MRWLPRDKRSPIVGDVRVVTKFLLWPKTLSALRSSTVSGSAIEPGEFVAETRWMEFARIQQRFDRYWEEGPPRWKDELFVDQLMRWNQCWY